MATISTSKERCVAGFVKWKPNNDGSTTFTVAGKRGQRFTLSDRNEHAAALRSAKRALVRYEAEGGSPKVRVVILNPSNRLIRQHQEQCKP